MCKVSTKSKRISSKRALRIIEGLCLLDEHGERNQVTYKIAHVGLNECKISHDDWKDEVLDIEKKLKATGII